MWYDCKRGEAKRMKDRREKAKDSVKEWRSDRGRISQCEFYREVFPFDA